LYVPSTRDQGIEGLVLMLHGCKQDPVDFAVGTRGNETAEAGRMIAVYPGQVSPANPAGCWNWFEPRDQRRGSGEPAILADLARSLAAEYGVPHERVFVAGLSAGGAMAAILAQTYPDVFAAAGIHSGLAAGSAVDVASAFAAMKGSRREPTVARRSDATAAPRLIVFHGSADSTVHPSNAETIVEARRPPDAVAHHLDGRTDDGRRFRRIVHRSVEGDAVLEHWTVEGLGHAWSGGNRLGSYTDPTGPDASAQMVRFFLDPRRPGPLE
jgi:poly(hydroxyalkanoate) depolymerase family esterase